MRNVLLTIAMIMAVMTACEKEQPENPYEQVVYEFPEVTADLSALQPGNFAYLHEKVFRPTCANSGCHDGTFEPAFTGISSSYNSLVNHPGISNDLENSYEHRVVPGDPDNSLLWARMTVDLPNSSGIMPLTVDAGSDWPDQQAYYRSLIYDWIAAGAPDMFGTPAPPAGADFPPGVEGLLAFPEGNTTNPYQRDPEEAGITPIEIESAPVDVWIYIEDDNTAQSSMVPPVVMLSESLSDFSEATSYTMSQQPQLTGVSLGGQNVPYIWKATIDFSEAQPGDHFYLRCVLDDNVQPEAVTIPNEGSSPIVNAIFSLKVP